MKPLLSILSSLPAAAQPTGTNTIIVHTTTIESVMKNLKQMKIGVANDGFGTITTIPKYQEDSRRYFQITVVIKDSTDYITGVFELGMPGASKMPAEVVSKDITLEIFKGNESGAG